MTDKNKEKEKKDLEYYKGWLKGVAYLEFGHAIAYVVLAVLVFVLSNGTDIARNAFNITEPIGGMSIEVVSCITGVISAILVLVLGILILKSLQPGAAKLALAVEIIATISILITVSVAEYIRKHNK